MNLRYERTVTTVQAYLVFLDEKPVAMVSQKRGRWTAVTTSRPHLSAQGAQTRHEATMELLGKLAEIEGLG
jgi:hypothetical protein